MNLNLFRINCKIFSVFFLAYFIVGLNGVLAQVNGDYRTTGSGTWISNNSSQAIWERYTSGNWVVSNSPSFTTSNTIYIGNGHTLTTSGSYGNGVNFKIENGGIFKNNHPGTINSIKVFDGGLLKVNAEMTIVSTGTFEVENNGEVVVNHAFGIPSSSIWNGIEVFHPESTFTFKDWDGANDKLVVDNTGISTNTYNGYTAAFGTIVLDFGSNLADNDDMVLLGNGVAKNLAHSDLIFRSNDNDNANISISTTGSVLSGVGGDFIVEELYSGSQKITFKTTGYLVFSIEGNMELGAATTRIIDVPNAGNYSSVNIGGDLNISPNGVLNFNSSSAGGAVSVLNLKGDLTVAGSGLLYTSNSNAIGQFNFTGAGDGLSPQTTQEVDVASTSSNTNANIEFNIQTGAYVRLVNNNLKITATSPSINPAVNVKAEGTLDFSWNGSTPLYIKGEGSHTSDFHSFPGSILKVTSLQGIVSSGAIGNVRTTTRTFDGLSDFHYIGLGNQNTGNALPSSIRNLYINNTGGINNNFVTLSNGQKSVRNTLTMTEGNIISTPSSRLSIGTSVLHLGTLNYTSGYVLGTMRRWFYGTNSGNASGLFPMAFDDSGLKNRHVKVEYTSAPSLGGYLDATFINSPMNPAGNYSGLPIQISSTGGFGFDVTTTEDQGYWEMDNLSSALNDGNFTMSLTGEGFTTINNMSEITLLKRVGTGNWFCPGTHIAATGSIPIPTVSRSGISGWSNFGFGGTLNSPLPIELSSFEVSCIKELGEVEIKWTTESELNSSHYRVEKSRDGINWTELSEVDAAGNSNSTIHYKEIDSNPWDGISYYRLKQFDFNGEIQEFDAVSTSCSIKESKALIYPNPSNGDFTVEINWNKTSANTQLQILDLKGQLVHQQEINLKEGVKQIHFNNGNLEKGTYLIVFPNIELKPIRVVISN